VRGLRGVADHVRRRLTQVALGGWPAWYERLGQELRRDEHVEQREPGGDEARRLLLMK
jgi:hypothetical protein